MMRFYVKGKDDPHGSHVALYVGNLPTSLNQKQYERILGDICSRGGEVKSKIIHFYLYNILVTFTKVKSKYFFKDQYLKFKLSVT